MFQSHWWLFLEMVWIFTARQRQCIPKVFKGSASVCLHGKGFAAIATGWLQISPTPKVILHHHSRGLGNFWATWPKKGLGCRETSVLKHCKSELIVAELIHSGHWRCPLIGILKRTGLAETRKDGKIKIGITHQSTPPLSKYICAVNWGENGLRYSQVWLRVPEFLLLNLPGIFLAFHSCPIAILITEDKWCSVKKRVISYELWYLLLADMRLLNVKAWTHIYNTLQLCTYFMTIQGLTWISVGVAAGIWDSPSSWAGHQPATGYHAMVFLNRSDTDIWDITMKTWRMQARDVQIFRHPAPTPVTPDMIAIFVFLSSVSWIGWAKLSFVSSEFPLWSVQALNYIKHIDTHGRGISLPLAQGQILCSCCVVAHRSTSVMMVTRRKRPLLFVAMFQTHSCIGTRPIPWYQPIHSPRTLQIPNSGDKRNFSRGLNWL